MSLYFYELVHPRWEDVHKWRRKLRKIDKIIAITVKCRQTLSVLCWHM